MSNLEQAARMALEALETISVDVKITSNAYEAQRQAIAALSHALEQPKRKWVGLNDVEIARGNAESWVTIGAWQSAVWWAERKLKEKNT